ncbi:hypothetical protein [Neobacillus dielmonensis]|uniref:hypothetical protein n=1 Tax=Neobacillus dielmonensis TaxID=1347369 RepID=UPI0005A7B4AF|nr:hypothetical protein [Neobacillus dielmonensis]
MDATAWLSVSIIGYSLAGVLFAVTIFLFIKMNIPALIGELTGRTAAKQIQEIREHNHSGSKRPTSPFDRLSRARSGRLGRTGSAKLGTAQPGSLPNEVKPIPATVLLGGEATELLAENTELLQVAATQELVDETVLLKESIEETTLLNETALLDEAEEQVPEVAFKIVKDIKVTHTSETI